VNRTPNSRENETRAYSLRFGSAIQRSTCLSLITTSNLLISKTEPGCRSVFSARLALSALLA